LQDGGKKTVFTMEKPSWQNMRVTALQFDPEVFYGIAHYPYDLYSM
jgi:hypothetical protein